MLLPVIDFAQAFGVSFFLTLLVFGFALSYQLPAEAGNMLVYYIGTALVFFSLSFYFCLKLVERAAAFHEKAFSGKK